MDFAIIIGLITCVADIIPFIGPFLGCAPAVLFAFMDSPMKALWVLILFVIVQWVENNILAPKLIGDSTGLNPLVILISIISLFSMHLVKLSEKKVIKWKYLDYKK